MTHHVTSWNEIETICACGSVFPPGNPECPLTNPPGLVHDEQTKFRSGTWYAKNRDQVLKKMKENRSQLRAEHRDYQLLHPQKMLFLNAKHRAIRENVEFDITESDIIIPSQCPLLGIPLFPKHSGRRGAGPNSPSLDRIDSSKGYIKGNIQVISFKANAIKHNATLQELRTLTTNLGDVLECVTAGTLEI